MSASLTAQSEQRKAARSAQGTQRVLPKDDASLSFADNDYLGLTREPRVAEAAIRAIRDSGTGARAARHLAGPCPEHASLERPWRNGRERRPPLSLRRVTRPLWG